MLIEQIFAIYPNLQNTDFVGINATIQLQNDGDGDYIKSWTNENPQPTAEQLASTGK
jgi:hypothetical protein